MRSHHEAGSAGKRLAGWLWKLQVRHGNTDRASVQLAGAGPSVPLSSYRPESLAKEVGFLETWGVLMEAVSL